MFTWFQIKYGQQENVQFSQKPFCDANCSCLLEALILPQAVLLLEMSKFVKKSPTNDIKENLLRPQSYSDPWDLLKKEIR